MPLNPLCFDRLLQSSFKVKQVTCGLTWDHCSIGISWKIYQKMFCTHRWSLGKNAFVKLLLITSGLFLWLHQKTCSKFLKARWTRKHAYKLCFMASTKLSKISLLYRRTILQIASETTPSSNGSKAILHHMVDFGRVSQKQQQLVLIHLIKLLH